MIASVPKRKGKSIEKIGQNGGRKEPILRPMGKKKKKKKNLESHN